MGGEEAGALERLGAAGVQVACFSKQRISNVLLLWFRAYMLTECRCGWLVPCSSAPSLEAHMDTVLLAS